MNKFSKLINQLKLLQQLV